MHYRSFILAVVLCSCRLLAGAQDDTTHPVWPSAPDRARIQHLRTISSMESLEPKKGFFSKVIGFLFGSEQQSHWLVQPVGIAVTADGIVYVADPGARGVHCLNLPKKEYDFIAESKSGPFRSPVGCAIDREGNLYVTDSERGLVAVFNEDRDPRFEFSAHLQRPTGIQVSGEKVYVADAARHAVVLCDRKGAYLGEFGQRGAGQGEFNFPVQLAVRDSISVVDAMNYRIQTFDLAGKFSSSFGDIGNVPGRFASPKSIALDADGNRYVTDALMDNFQIFDPQGRLLLIVGSKGTRNGEFMTPSGICIDGQDHIYVVDVLNRRIQIFRYIR
ncbi:MAG TPA: 6-bladed beta-propeller [Bacteroidota bacterium]|nr:6-bladed beta-propeller [Bacteroidota bacterium]